MANGFYTLSRTALGLWGRRLAFPLVLAAGWLYHPFSTEGPTLCLSQVVWAVACPGCGMTRAVTAFAHGAWAQAAAFNPMVFPIMGLFTLVTVMAWRRTRAY